MCSSDTTRTALATPARPSASGTRFGTSKSEMPLVPAGASGSRASTRWQTFSAMSWSPQEMKIFCPVTAKLPSPRGSARVRTAPTSEPACGSVRFIVPVQSPATSRGR